MVINNINNFNNNNNNNIKKDMLRLRFMNWEMSKGVEFNIFEVLKTIKICDKRNVKLKKKYIEVYEFITGDKYSDELLKTI